MFMVECQYFQFAAPPKSGCRWMEAAMKQLGGFGGGELHRPYHRKTSPPMVSLVRDPCEWIRSYFQHVTTPVAFGPVDRFLDYGNRIETDTYDNDGLARFVSDYLAGPKNQIGDMCAQYRADIYWRIEDMPWPLQEFCGKSIKYPDRMETRNKLKLPHELRVAVREHEPRHVERWKY